MDSRLHLGVCHGEEIASLFKPSMVKEPTVNSAEHKTIDRMVSFNNWEKIIFKMSESISFK